MVVLLNRDLHVYCDKQGYKLMAATHEAAGPVVITDRFKAVFLVWFVLMLVIDVRVDVLFMFLCERLDFPLQLSLVMRKPAF